jgi:uncharacterized protein YneF (UPF0154 family)
MSGGHVIYIPLVLLAGVVIGFWICRALGANKKEEE